MVLSNTKGLQYCFAAPGDASRWRQPSIVSSQVNAEIATLKWSRNIALCFKNSHATGLAVVGNEGDDEIECWNERVAKQTLSVFLCF
jgi:hypothetical protein